MFHDYKSIFFLCLSLLLGSKFLAASDPNLRISASHDYYEMGLRYKHSTSSADWLIAENMLKLASDYGHSHALIELSDLYFNKLNDSNDRLIGYRKSHRCLMKAAELCNATAYHNLAVHYYSGYGVEKSIPRAFALLKKSEELGFERAKLSLERLYKCSDLSGVCPKTYLNLFLSAARRGNKSALFKVGLLYRTGEVEKLSQNEELGTKLIKKAAELNYPPALYELALESEYGLFCDQDTRKSKYYLKRALSNDRGVPENDVLSLLGLM